MGMILRNQSFLLLFLFFKEITQIITKNQIQNTQRKRERETK